MVRSRKNPARGKRAKQGKVAALAAQPQARARAVAFGVAAALLRRNGSVNFAVAGLAAVTMALAITGAILRPDIIPFSGPALDASGNRVAASDRVQVSQVQASQALPDDGFGFDRAAIDAVSRPAAAPDASDPSVVKIVTYPNGDAVPTDPVRFPALELQANAANDGRQAQARVAPDQRAGAVSPAATSVYNGSALIAEARKYIGTNPTRRATLWCGAFLDMVLRKTGHRGGGNLALAYARYGKRIPGPKVGAIVVLRRQGGGHVGIVTGVDSNGNPIVISGNHNHRVAVATYPRSRVIAYVVPQ